MNELVPGGMIGNEGHGLRLRITVCRYEAMNALASLRLHWPEYLMEAGELGLYMFFTCAFATLLQHPASPVRHFIFSGVLRRALMGLAIGATVIAIVPDVVTGSCRFFNLEARVARNCSAA